MGRWRKLGIIAGGGALPARIASACEARGEDFHVIRIAGAADAVEKFSGDDCGIGEAGKIIRILKSEGCDAVVFAGSVRRPDFTALRADWRGAALLPKIMAAAARGDGPILDVLVKTLESEGLIVIGAEEAMDSLAASQGPLGKHAPTDDDMADILKAASVIRSLGAFDIGQAAVVAGGHVLAVEAAEGTDAMLIRCAGLPVRENIAGRNGVLVKRPKPGQELRVDLPVIGPETIKNVRDAGLSGVAVEAGVALIVDRDEVIALADEAGLFVYGFSASEMERA